MGTLTTFKSEGEREKKKKTSTGGKISRLSPDRRDVVYPRRTYSIYSGGGREKKKEMKDAIFLEIGQRN